MKSTVRINQPDDRTAMANTQLDRQKLADQDVDCATPSNRAIVASVTYLAYLTQLSSLTFRNRL